MTIALKENVKSNYNCQLFEKNVIYNEFLDRSKYYTFNMFEFTRQPTRILRAIVFPITEYVSLDPIILTLWNIKYFFSLSFSPG